MNTTTMKLSGYQQLKHGSKEFEDTMGKAHYTLEEVHVYHEDIKDQESKLARTTAGSELHVQYKRTLHVMLEFYERMQENLHDYGPRKADTLFERLIGHK